MIVFSHTKFGVLRIQGSKVKRGQIPPPRSERVFQIQVQIGLKRIGLNCTPASNLPVNDLRKAESVTAKVRR